MARQDARELGLGVPVIRAYALELVGMAVIAPVEEHDDVATRCHARQPHRLDHCRRRTQTGGWP
jgi:hypothetical protein